MTCIAAARQPDGSILVGADSQVSAGDLKFYPVGSKILQKHGFTYASAGTTRLLDILSYAMEEPEGYAEMDAKAWLIQKWVPEIRRLLNEAGLKEVVNNVETHESTAIIVMQGRIFAFWSNFSITEHAEYFAMGSGREFALGALFVQPHNLQGAIEAAIHLNNGCSGEIVIVKHEPTLYFEQEINKNKKLP